MTSPSENNAHSSEETGNLRLTLWWRRFRTRDLDEIVRLFQQALPNDELRQHTNVELTRVRVVYKTNRNERTIHNATIREQRISRTTLEPYTAGQIDQWLQGAAGDHYAKRPAIRNFILRCSAGGYQFELRLGGSDGSARERMEITVSWPGTEPWREFKELYTYLDKKDKLGRLRNLVLYCTAISLGIQAVQADIQRLRPRFEAPHPDYTNLAETIAGHTLQGVFVAFIAWAICSSVSTARINLEPPRLVVAVNGWINRIPRRIQRIPPIRNLVDTARHDPASINAASFAITVAGVLIALLTWLFPLG